ncbi:RusA family crossover junction endodeoxyribonuclease [Methylobacterium sp. CM6247]
MAEPVAVTGLQHVIGTLPYPPSASRMWRHVGRKVLRSAEYEKWPKAAVDLIHAETKGRGIASPYGLKLHIGRPDRRRR